VITLTLIHPLESLPPQSWTFEGESIIRIGRASDNHVVLYSAVVSRHHVEVRRVTPGWEIVSLGANGTYINGEKILQSGVSDGVIFRLARSGPQIQIHLETNTLASSELDIWATSHKPSSV
jgi:pSer/pThr/pTyr-binding forkhead associated (FHA) protein